MDIFLSELVKVVPELEIIEIDNLSREQQLFLFQQLPSLKNVNNINLEKLLLMDMIKYDKEGKIIYNQKKN